MKRFQISEVIFSISEVVSGKPHKARAKNLEGDGVGWEGRKSPEDYFGTS